MTRTALTGDRLVWPPIALALEKRIREALATPRAITAIALAAAATKSYLADIPKSA
jgi:hypothetical protein